MTSSYRLCAALIAPAALWGCDAEEKVDLGNNQVEVTGERLTDYAGSWSGYAEGFLFGKASDRLRITLTSEGSGVLEVGEGAPLPPPDPSLGYPPGAGRLYPPRAPTSGLVPGFAYSINDADVDDSRLRLRLAEGELYAEWCALITPVLDGRDSTSQEESYSCIPNTGVGYFEQGCYVNAENPIPVDCGKLDCITLCGCEASGCFVRNDAANILLDAALEAGGSKLVGTLVLGSERVTVRMTRVD